MAKPNFSYEKRQRELAQQKKKEEKRLRKLERKAVPGEAADPAAPDPEGAAAQPDAT